MKVKDEYKSDTKPCRGLIYDYVNQKFVMKPPMHTE